MLAFSVRGPVAVPAAGGATTTWDSANKYVDLTLSNGDLTATALVIQRCVVRSIASASSGKIYWEMTINDVELDAGQSIGIVNSTFPFNGSFDVGGDANSFGYFGDGTILENSSPVGGAISAYTDASVVSVAFDIPNARIWFRVGAGNWNNNASADPATNTLGRTVSITGPFYAAISLRYFSVGAAAQLTANFGGSAYAQSAPSGFVNW